MWLMLLKNQWTYIVIVIVGAIAYGGFWHLRATSIQNAFDKFKNDVQAATLKHQAEDLAKVETTAAIIKGKDDEREKLLADTGAAWSAELVRMRDKYDTLSKGQKPTRVTATICNGQNANQRLSDALESYRTESRRILSTERQETGRLLAICESQTAEWNNLKSGIAAIRNANK